MAIDVLGEVAGVGMYADALADAQLMPEFEVPVLSLKKLIASKKAAGRSKDLSLLLHLEYIAKAEQRLNSTPVAWPERVERLLALYKDKKIEQYQMVNYAYDAAAEIDSSEISHLMSMLPMEISAGLQDRVSNPTPSDDEFGCSADKLAQARERYLKVHNYFKQS